MSLTKLLLTLTRPLRLLFNRCLRPREIEASLTRAKNTARKRVRRALKDNEKAYNLTEDALDFLYERRREIRREAADLESLDLNLNFRA